MSAADNVASPCIGVCKMDSARGWCRGCLRTLNEIARWSKAEDKERLQILDRIAERRAISR